MPEVPSHKSISAAVFTFFLLALLMFAAIYQIQPPAPVPLGAPPTEFSSARAMEHLKAIAQKPHPTGSPENASVREYIMKRLAAIGVEPQVQTTAVARYEPKWRGPAVAATVSNIVARLKGTSSTGAVMLAAHYDSVPSGPGASDDGSGTVTVLETARALVTGPPLRNDVIFLLTDGEEQGMLGAKAFVDEHPWAKDAALVLNFEARGACGPSAMFETSAGNGWLVREFAKAAPHPVTSSLMYDVYKHLPNDTDMTIFKGAGLAGLNFAYSACWPRYHTTGDSVQNIDERSLQHDGSYALALARHFGNLSFENTRDRDAVYFSLFGRTLYYSQAWVVPLTALVLFAFAGVVVLGLRKRLLQWRGITLGFFGWLTGVTIAVAVSKILWFALRRTGFASLLPYGMAYNSEIYALGFVALTVGAISALYVILQEKTSVGNLAVGALAWWAVLALLTGLYVPGASYLFAWPLLSSLIELGYAFARRNPESEVESALVWTFPALVGILLFASLPYLVLNLLSTSGLVTLIIAVALLLGFLVPHLHIMTARRRWFLPAAASLAGIGLIMGGMFSRGFDAKHPRADSVFYALNADTGKAVWASTDKKPDAWTLQFFSGRVEKGWLADWVPVSFPVPILQSQAPAARLAAPNVSLMDDITMGDSRVLRLWITSPRQASIIWVSFPKTPTSEIEVNGKKVGSRDRPSQQGISGLYYVGVPQNGIVLTLTVKASSPLEMHVLDLSYGLPETPGLSFKARPDGLMPTPSWPHLDSSTLVSKTFRFEARP